MNHIYRSVWNEHTGTFVAVSENAKSGGKKASAGASIATSASFALKALAASLLLTFGSTSYALPVGGEVVAGSATVTSGNGSMTINQTSQNAVLNWQSFNIGASEAVRFVQPNSNSVALNRVIGADPSSILGSLSANGKVFLINPNGILFGKGASVNVGGLVASTRNISDSDFMAGNYKFAGAGGGDILNQGTINADGGYVALLGAHVSNEGVISARLGTVALAAGNGITLDVVGDGLLNVAVNEGAVKALVQNGGMIQADGGHVLMTAQAAGNLLQTVVNNTGVIQARTIENRDGVIKLLGDMQSGTVSVGGTLDASAPNGGSGGFIETSAAHVKIAPETHITTTAAAGTTGTWLIDPIDYTIAASGGDITGAQLSASLGSTNVTILSTSGASGTNGDVNVNDTITWSANKLTLNAQNNININTAMNGSGTASLALQYGQAAVAAGNSSKVNVNAPVNLPAGNNFSTKQGLDGAAVNYTVITDLGAVGSTTGTDLQGINGGLASNYVLGRNIDATETSGWNGGAGFNPLGNTTAFTAIFDGLGHTISGLTINRPSENQVGLFGVANSATLRNVGLIGVSIRGSSYVGALIGQSQSGMISNAWSSGTVGGNSYVGGLVGLNNGGNVFKAYSTTDVTGTSTLIGGLIGQARFYGTVFDSYASGRVNGNGASMVGGLIGQVRAVELSNSYATGAVTGGSQVGGLVGYLDGFNGGKVTASYASGVVSGSSLVGGLVGLSSGSIVTSYWDSYSTGQVKGIGSGSATGITALTSDLSQSSAANYAFEQSAYTGFDFTNTWVMHDTDTSPVLRAFVAALTIPAGSAPETVPVAVVDSNPRNQNAIASAVSLMSVMPSQGNMADAQLPSPQVGRDASMQGGLAGLNLSITGDGVKLPPVSQLSDARDDKN